MALFGIIVFRKNIIFLPGVVRHMVVNDLPMGRSVDETLRMVDALQHIETHGEVCPADWKKGERAMPPTVRHCQFCFFMFLYSYFSHAQASGVAEYLSSKCSN